MGGPLTHAEPQHEARGNPEGHRGHVHHERNTERHQQWTGGDHQAEPGEAGHPTGQRNHCDPDGGDDDRTHDGVDATAAPEIATVGNHTTRNRHARHVIGFASWVVAPHRALVAVALVAALSARIGSEAAARSHDVIAGVGWLRIVVPSAGGPIAWWLVCGLTVLQFVRCSQRRVVTPRVVGWTVAIVVSFAGHGAVQWERLATPRTGDFSGIVHARSDAVVRNGAVTLVVEVAGENFRLTARGRDRAAVRRVRMGDVLLVDAERVAHDDRTLRFSAGRHVQGDLRNVVVHATAPSPAPWHRAANRIHGLIDRGSRTMQSADAALVRGLVLGDESRQPARMTGAFRAAGLGHLLAVSGQNVALLLAALTPALRRLSRWPRLVSALGIVAMFALITRLESSVVRAAVMAAVVQAGYAIGRDVLPLRALAITVLAIVALDPLATWSIGFVLSVAATTGLVVITPLLGRSVFAATTAAQLGVAPFSTWWFGTMPIIALLTNVLAVPVASAVMMIGPLLLGIAAFAPDVVAGWCAVLVVAAVRWVWWVAELSARLAVPGWLDAVGWLVVLAVVVRRVGAVARGRIHPHARL